MNIVVLVLLGAVLCLDPRDFDMPDLEGDVASPPLLTRLANLKRDGSDNPDELADIADLLDEVGKRDLALEVYQLAINLRPNWVEVLYNFAICKR
jgi:hypothetical protein